MLKVDKFLVLQLGAPAPDFTITTLEGKQLRLSELRGKVVFLDFWATWCGPCIAEIPKVRQAYEKFAPNGQFEVIGVSLDDSEDTVRSFLKKNKMPWHHTVLGPANKNALAKLYNVTGVPATFLIDREGKVIAKHVGGERLQKIIKKHLKQD